MARLTRSQLKNRSKRLRARRPCHRCGRPGHKRSECNADSIRSPHATSAQSDEAASADSVQCLGCRRFGHRLTDCTARIAQPPHKPTLTAADALSHHDAHRRDNGSSSTAAECAEAVSPVAASTGSEATARFCYHCGNASHTASQCTGQFAFAVCFICQAVGHLARHCPNSDRGIYVRGGHCHTCGSTQHKAKHCTAQQTTQQHSTIQAAAGEEAATQPKRLSLHQLGLSHIKRAQGGHRSSRRGPRSAAGSARQETGSSEVGSVSSDAESQH